MPDAPAPIAQGPGSHPNGASGDGVPTLAEPSHASGEPPGFPAEGLRRFLAEEAVTLLRNPESVFDPGASGDVDVLAGDPRLAEHLLGRHLGRPLRTVRRSYVTTYVYAWGQLDVLPRLEWRGAEYLAVESVTAERRELPYGLRLPRPAHVALVSWFSSLLWGGFFKQRYASEIVSAARTDAEAFRAAAEYACGPNWGTRLLAWAEAGDPSRSADHVTALRRAVWVTALRRDPLRTVADGLKFVAAEVALRIRPPLPWIAILGPDGAGKTSIIDGIAADATPLLPEVSVYHWRPGVLGGRSPDTGVPVTDPHGQAPRGNVASVAKLGFLILDWWLGYSLPIARDRAKERLVVFDRCFNDLLVDPLRYRYGGPRWMAALASRFVPSPAALIVLDAPEEVLRSRKLEVSAEETARQRRAYLELAADHPRGFVVNAARPIDEVVAEVRGIIEDIVARRGR